MSILTPRGPHIERIGENEPTVLVKLNATEDIRARFQSTVVGDVNEEDGEEIITVEVWDNGPGLSSALVVRDGKTGVVQWSHEFDGEVIPDVTLASLDNSSLPKIVCETNEEIYTFDGNGTMFWNQSAAQIFTHFDLPPVAVDVFGDSRDELVIPSRDGKIFVLNGTDGETIWSMDLVNKVYLPMVICSPIAVGDIDSDGSPEILVNFYKNAEDVQSYTCAIDPREEEILWVHYAGNHWLHFTPVIADLDGDGDPEIILPTWRGLTTLRGRDGSSFWNYTFEDNIDFFSSEPAIADIDGDGQLDVLQVISRQSVYAFHGRDGSIEWKFDASRMAGVTQLIVGEFDGDIRNEVVLISHDATVAAAINAEDASNQWSTDFGANGLSTTPIDSMAGDLNGNGHLDILLAYWDAFIPSTIYVIEPVNSGDNLYWNPRGGSTGFARTHNVADFDQDFDGFTDEYENTIGTDPTLSDSDGDLFPDAWEVTQGFSPTSPEVSLVEMILYYRLVVVAVALVSVIALCVILIVCHKRKLKQQDQSSANGT